VNEIVEADLFAATLGIADRHRLICGIDTHHGQRVISSQWSRFVRRADRDQAALVVELQLLEGERGDLALDRLLTGQRIETHREGAICGGRGVLGG